MKRLSIQLSVSDLQRSVAFYRDVLGFTVKFSMSNDNGEPTWTLLGNGDVDIQLTVPTPEFPSTPEGSAVMLNLTVGDDVDIDAFYEQVKATGATFSSEIRDEPWGDRVFIVRDPDCYQCMIAKTVNAPDFGEMPVDIGEDADALFSKSS